jgi:hypothetical protein
LRVLEVEAERHPCVFRKVPFLARRNAETNAALGREGVLAGIAELILTGIGEILQAVDGGILDWSR